MTERELILNILNRLGKEIYHQDNHHIEFENGYGGESVDIDFDDFGNVTGIAS